ncbi:CDP-glycerol glycerophosphotransferase family protein [Psychrobacter sp. SMN/5/1215-MNA-CIBAN-0208]|uniref:CDP-glycerol glycerophosphotransferase family protein n=1 Tax=Psychrobacter sp. SMN/5/1215-MNA-CIBAN-0208 TaxID=3140442 RepID=UPI00332F0FA0
MNISEFEKKIIEKLPISEKEKKILNRRLKKLKKEPKSFFQASYKKRTTQAISKIPIKYNGANRFTVISAVYNVEEYLDEYLKSLVHQSLSFKKNIQIILVDDGSTDSSASVIRKWIKKYPKNITYLYKENGGQASARNLGLTHVNTDWVTFIDPDDFVSDNYFLEIDKFIGFNNEMILVACPLVLYIEEEKIFKDSHPLNYRFKKGKQVFPIKNLENHVQLSVSTAIFKHDLIKNTKFNEDIKPSFEDAKFVLDYLLDNLDYKIGFIDNINYFYRKRAAGNSTLDTAWFNPHLFTTVLEQGVMNSLLQAEKKLGYVPEYVQRSALYHVYWYFGRIINRESSLSHLSNIEKERFFGILRLIFSKIDNSTIEKFNLGGAWFFHKVGFLGLFKDSESKIKIAYIENFDVKKNQVLIKFFSNSEKLESYLINGKDTIPLYRKSIRYSFYDQVFTNEYRVWISCDDLGALRINHNNDTVKLTFKGKQYDSIDLSDVKSQFLNESKSFENIWIFIDSSHKADDNAEHLYRYISNKYNHKLFFALDRNSRDWDRLKSEGFELLDFGSQQFESMLRQCDKIISSNIDGYITNYFKDNSLVNKDFIFLQHGVILHDLSAWLNTKKNLDLFITTTKGEYESICGDGTPYIFTAKETKLTGLPRHDSLLENNKKSSKTILIMPTWRNNIVGKSVDATTRTYNVDFINSQYFKFWKGLLDNKEFEKMVLDNGYKVIFAPHSNVQQYLSDFNVPHYIKTWQYADGEIQKLFQECSMMITDYSSVAFEVAYLKKPIVYYQFDREEVFNGSHTFEGGYFSYDKDGFGPIITNEKDLLEKLKESIANKCQMLEPYKSRVDTTFPFRDGKNSERVYNAIISLDKNEVKEVDVLILYDFTLKAYECRAWNLVESRSYLLTKYGNNDQKDWAEKIFNEALFNQNKFIELFESINTNSRVVGQKEYWRAKVASATARWQDVVKLLESIPILDNELTLMLLYSYAETGKADKFNKLKEEIQNINLNIVESLLVQAWSLHLDKQWVEIIQLLEMELPNLSSQELKDYQPQILIAEAYRNLSEFTKAHQQLANFETHTVNNPRCRIEIAQLAFARENYVKAINQYNLAVNEDIKLLPEAAIWQYVLSHWHMEHIQKLATMLPEIISLYPINSNFKLLYTRVLAEQSKWEEVLVQASDLRDIYQPEIVYPLTLAKYRLGFIDEAYKTCIKPNNQHSYKYWKLISEIALLVEDIELAKYCCRGMIAIYPSNDISENWSKLNSL